MVREFHKFGGRLKNFSKMKKIHKSQQQEELINATIKNNKAVVELALQGNADG